MSLISDAEKWRKHKSYQKAYYKAYRQTSKYKAYQKAYYLNVIKPKRANKGEAA